jgi:hypothetical protein
MYKIISFIISCRRKRNIPVKQETLDTGKIQRKDDTEIYHNEFSEKLNKLTTLFNQVLNNPLCYPQGNKVVKTVKEIINKHYENKMILTKQDVESIQQYIDVVEGAVKYDIYKKQ